jgi:hypothetical protein
MFKVVGFDGSTLGQFSSAEAAGDYVRKYFPHYEEMQANQWYSCKISKRNSFEYLNIYIDPC